ncbi:MAG: STAS domain-containing protein [Crocosphaera sp.]
MNFDVEQLDNGIKQVTLVGRMDLKGTNEIEMIFNAQVNTSTNPVLINMAGVEFLASIGIRLLLSGGRALSRRGTKMAILNPQPLVEDVFKTAGIDQLIEIYHSYDQASQALLTMTPE